MRTTPLRMNILIIGGGGREHALAWKLAQSPDVTALTVAPGNAGCDAIPLVTGGASATRPINPRDLDAVCAAASDLAADLVVIGPDDPLADGLADRLRALSIPTFGPSRAAAKLEWSKSFAKAFMARHAIPTAAHGVFTDPVAAKAFLNDLAPPYVLKADGLAAGKGVVIADDRQTAEHAIETMLAGQFGEASKTLLIEEFLPGQEASVFALTDGETFRLLPASQDHKRAFDGDQGPNTGGMGAYSPTPVVDAAVLAAISDTIIAPTIAGLADEGAPFVGVLYVGVMLTPSGPKVVEFNARFGDPETQVLLPRLQSDLAPLLLACATQELARAPALAIDPRAAVTVILATNGYPGAYQKGSIIQGVEAAQALDEVLVFHAGTQRDDQGVLRANGGRVLNISALGDTVETATARAYAGVDAIDWPEGFCRRDIAWRALTATKSTG